MSSSRHGAPFISYSDSPLRHSDLVIRTSERSIGRSPAELSIVSETSARPRPGSLGGAGKDDVFHLRGAQSPGTLRAEHPRHRVDDVRLARPVRADDNRDTRLELEGGGVCKGLEALQS